MTMKYVFGVFWSSGKKLKRRKWFFQDSQCSSVQRWNNKEVVETHLEAESSEMENEVSLVITGGVMDKLALAMSLSDLPPKSRTLQGELRICK